MKEVKIGYQMIGKEPKIVGVIGGKKALELVQYAENEDADLLEIRVDSFDTIDPREIAKIFQQVKQKTNVPLIATIRRLKEGGSYYKSQGSEQKRLEIFHRIMEYVDALDIELSATEILDPVIKEGKEQGIAIITSHHDFYRTPSMEEFEKIIEDAYEKDGDIIKISTTALSKKDIITSLKILLKLVKGGNKPSTVISMSEIGTISRLIFPLYGSCLTYGFLSDDSPSAPGQVTTKNMHAYINEYKDIIPKNMGNLPMIYAAIEKNLYPFKEKELVALL